ncbi:hypothetical protein OAC63_04655 [Amylibacter sp.]|jgi:hypothetical protein|nr:hypothetical protein [Amylibacter sp.]
MAAKYRLNKKNIVGGKYTGILRARGKGNPTPTLAMLSGLFLLIRLVTMATIGR